MDEGRVNPKRQGGRGKDMVDALPVALIPISAKHTVLSTGFAGDAMQLVFGQPLQDGRIVVVVEVTGNNGKCFGRTGKERIKGLTQTVGHSQTEGTAVTLSAIAAGCMNNKHMKGVARKDASADIKNVASGSHTLHRCDTKRLPADWGKRKRAIEQSHVDAMRYS